MIKYDALVVCVLFYRLSFFVISSFFSLDKEFVTKKRPTFRRRRRRCRCRCRRQSRPQIFTLWFQFLKSL